MKDAPDTYLVFVSSFSNKMTITENINETFPITMKCKAISDEIVEIIVESLKKRDSAIDCDCNCNSLKVKTELKVQFRDCNCFLFLVGIAVKKKTIMFNLSIET